MMPAPVAGSAVACTPILAITVRGGLSNQKECLVNAGIAASRLGVTLALPRFDLIGSGNEKFEPADAHYVTPYGDRDTWGHFNHLFNTSRALKSLEGQLTVIPRLRAGGGERPPTVTLPPVEQVVPDCGGRPRMQGTCEARPGDSSLLLRLLSTWERVIDTSCNAHVKTSRAQPDPPPAIIFHAGKSLCWNAYKSRFATTCKSRHAACKIRLQSLTWNRVRDCLASTASLEPEQCAIAHRE